MVDDILKNVHVLTKANIYWDGKVTSRTGYRDDGSQFTLGIITAGSYAFDVGGREVVRLMAGTAEILLPGEAAWRLAAAPDFFEVMANSTYQIRTDGIVEYLCDYGED